MDENSDAVTTSVGIADAVQLEQIFGICDAVIRWMDENSDAVTTSAMDG